MGKFQIWFYVISAVLIALAANSISAIWASKENKLTIWLLLVVIISPFVFITFGLATTKLGLAVSSATVDSLLTISTILVGLFLFHEWSNVSLYQYFGMTLALLGIVLMQFHK
ncbi:MAG: hypothetical protein AAB350_00180 [Patescibacteria group bacterium]